MNLPTFWLSTIIVLCLTVCIIYYKPQSSQLPQNDSIPREVGYD